MSDIVLFGGIDPGAKGGIVVIDARLRVQFQWAMPWCKGAGLDLHALHDRLCEVRELASNRGGVAYWLIEHQQSRPGEGHVGALSMGRSLGAIQMAMVCLRFPHDIQRPNQGENGWQRILKGIPGDDTKAQAIELCRRNLPDLDLTPGRARKPHEGLADAGAMALQARRMILGVA